jgi:L-lactate utilization protein LutB
MIKERMTNHMREEYQNWLWEKLGERTVENLKKHGFDAVFVGDASAARQVILDLTKGYRTFGFGGSETTRGLGIMADLAARGAVIYDHWQEGLTPEADLALRLDMGRCDCFFTSANAISATGEVVNVDGIGNRTNAMTFGPKKVVIVAGMNKVTADLASALQRVKEVAAPMRARSLNMPTPCAETGQCSDCNSPMRICRITTILHRRPMRTDTTVVLINQALGF